MTKVRAIRVASINHNDPSMGRLRLELRHAADCGLPEATGYRWVSIDRTGHEETDDCALASVAEAMDYLAVSWGTPYWGLRVGR